MQRIAPLTLCLVAVACSHKPTEGGLLAVVNIDSDAFVTCVELSVVDSSKTVLATTRAERGTRTQLQFAITQDKLPDDVTLRATGLYAATNDCSDAGVPNDSPSEQPGHFAPTIPEVDLTLHKPAPGDDADSDGFIAASKGGPDCDDTHANTNPAAPESCNELVDLNCNGKYGCQDPVCSSQACIAPAAQLAFLSAPQSATAAMCSAALVLEARDSTGAAAPVALATTVTLAEMGALGLAIYSDSGCTVAASSLDIPKGMKQVHFFARGNIAGATQLKATAAMLMPATQAFVVTPGPAVSVAFKTPPQTVKAFACSGAVTLEVRDQQGNASPVLADTPFTVTLTPPTNVALFTDAMCMTALASPRFASGSSSSTLYFKASRAPGTFDVTVVAVPLTPPAAQTQTVVPGDPTAIVFSTAPQTVVAGTCSRALTVKVQDALATDTTVAAALPVMLAGTTFTFFTGMTCDAATTVASANIAAGAGSATVYFTATLAGTPTVTAMGGGLANANQVETVQPGLATRLAFKSAAQGIAQSTCSSLVTLESRDAWGNPSKIAGVPLNIDLSASPSAGFTFSDGGGCGDPVTSVAILPGSSTTTFNFMGTAASTVTVTADSALDPDPTQIENIGVGPAAQLIFTTAPQTKVVNQCSAAVTLESHDSGGNVANVVAAVPVNLAASPSTSFGFYSDATCMTAVAQVSVPAGGTQATFYFKGTLAGAVQMTPTSSLMNPAPQTATLTPEVATAVAFSNPARTATSGLCSAALTLQSRDAFGNASNVSADVVLALSGAPASGLSFYADSSCVTAPIASTTILAGTQLATFYAQANLVPSYLLTATSGPLGQTTQVLTVTAASASKLVITTTAQPRVTGACSAAVTVQRRDPNDNPSTAGALTVNLAQSPSGGLTFYSDSGCTAAVASVLIANGSSTADFYFRGVTPGMPTVTASAGSLTPASQAQMINVGTASVLVITTPPQLGVAAGTCSAILTVESRDGFNNTSPVGGNTTLTFGAPPAGASFYSDPGCTSVIAGSTLSAGTSTASWYFKGTTALSFTMSVGASGFTGGTQGETIVAAGISQLSYITSARTQAAGVCSAIITLQRTDAFGNPVTAGAATVGLVAGPSTGFTFYTGATCTAATATTTVTIAAGQSTASFYVAGTLPGAVMMTATTAGASAAVQTDTVSALLPSHIVFTTPARAVTAGVCSAALTVQAQDTFNNPAAVGATTMVALSSTGGNMTFYSDAGCTMAVSSVSIPMGMTDATFFATGTLVATPTITATAGALGSANQGFTITAAAASKLVFTTPARTVAVGVCSSVATVRTQDVFGNTSGVAAATTLTPAAAPVGGVTFFSDASCATALGAGISLSIGQSAGSFFMKGGNTPQSVMVTVTSSPALTPAVQAETVVVGAPSKLVFTSAVRTQVMAGECAGPVTIQLQDVAGNPTTSATSTAVGLSVIGSAAAGFAFYTDAGCTAATSTASIPSGMQSVNVYVKDLTGGALTMTAASGVLTSGTQPITILNAVMTGTCTIANGTASQTCAISPALKDTTKTFLMFQALSASANASNTFTRCELTDTATLTCTRTGNTGDVNIYWSTVARPTGLTVQHLNGTVGTGTSQTVTIPTAVANVNDTFLLLSTDSTMTPFNDALTTAHLASTTQVTLQRLIAPTGTLKHSLQVVEWTGATVTRGSTSINNNSLTSNAVAVTDSGTAPAFLLSTGRWHDASTEEICRQSVHGALTSGTSLTFTRGAGAGGNCNNNQIDLEYERVALPSGNRVDTFTPSPTGTATGTPITMPNGAVDLTRALGFFSGQGIGGQASGECTDTTVDRPRDCLMRATFIDANNIDPERPAGVNSSSAFGLFMLQVSP